MTGSRHGQNTGLMLFASKSRSAAGIYLASWNSASGKMGEPELAAAAEEPSFLAHVSRNGADTILAVGQSAAEGGYIAAYRLEAATGRMKLLNRQPTLGREPVHLSVHPDGRSVYVANYWEAGVTSFALRGDGSLSEPVSHFDYRGRGAKTPRQDEPHAHGTTISPDGQMLLVNDLGLDCIHLYRLDAATAELTPNDPPRLEFRAGSGPRHSVFHPNGRWLYSIQELNSTVAGLEWDGKGELPEPFTTEAILPVEYAVERARACEIAVSRDGRFLYANNRGPDLFFVFGIGPGSGALKPQQQVFTEGLNARHFAMDGTGRWIIVSYETSGAIAVLRRDAQRGLLSRPVDTAALEAPVCALPVDLTGA